MATLTTKMVCASCSSEQDFVLEPEHNGPRSDYQCQTCGWYQTSTEGGYCEVLCSWLCDDAKGVADDVEQLAEYIWRTCQGTYGKTYAFHFAEDLLDVLKSLQEKAGIVNPSLPKSPEPDKV